MPLDTKKYPRNKPPVGSDVCDRFWPKVNKTDGCWEWTGFFNDHGYGMILYRGRQHRAHRVAYQLLVGPIPEGMHVLHNCDNRRCVNVAHLRLGTQRDNMRDLAERDRWRTRYQDAARQPLPCCPKGHWYVDGDTLVRKGAKRATRFCRQCRRTKAARNRHHAA